MTTLVRTLCLLGVGALLVFGAAGLSGHLVHDDDCAMTSGVEGSSTRQEIRWTPPGIVCSVRAAGADAFEERWLTGSWAEFVGALLVGFAAVGPALRRRPNVPAGLRLPAVTTLALAVAGTGAIFGGWTSTLIAGTVYGLPVAFAADVWLRPGRLADRPPTAGAVGVVVAFSATIVASAGYLYGFGMLAYAGAIALVAAAAALPWGRLQLAR